MNYGLYLSAAGVESYLYRQDVLANNLANVETTGFKPDLVFTRQRLVERLEEPSPIAPQWLLEQLGGGLFNAPAQSSLAQGAMTGTGNALDLAIEGDGFFAVASRPEDPASLRLTRDGHFTLNTAGELVTAGSGLRVLDTAGRAIRLRGSGDVRVDAAGQVLQNERPVATLRLVSAPATEIGKTGNNLFRPADPSGLTSATGVVHQGYLEASGVDPITTLNDLITATKNAQANAKLMQYHDHTMGQAVGTMGRVA